MGQDCRAWQLADTRVWHSDIYQYQLSICPQPPVCYQRASKRLDRLRKTESRRLVRHLLRHYRRNALKECHTSFRWSEIGYVYMDQR